MLRTLHIKDFAIAQNLTVEFQPGLNIITGETGTGKSILVGAISAVLGSRVSTEVVRTGSQKALVEAIFDISKLPRAQKILKKKGLENNSELFLRREISIKGSTRAFVNDTPVTIATLSAIGDLLVDLHGQNEHQSLLNKDTHRYFLDALGGLDHNLEKVANSYQTLDLVSKELHQLQKKQQAIEEKYELYIFQKKEIEGANLTPGEEDRLHSERNILTNTEKIFALSSEFSRLANGTQGPNLQDLMGEALHILRELAGFSDNLESLFKEFSSAKIIIEETDRSIEEFQSRLEFDPARLEEIEERLSTISQLKKKYGKNIEAILAYLEKIEAELQLRDNFDFELGKLNERYQEARTEYARWAATLSRARKKVARKLEESVIRQLREIGMPKTRFKVKLDWLEDSSGIFDFEQKTYYGDEKGLDQVEFYISPNPGETYKPLIKIASGGEVSRIMLALKNILAEVDRIPLLIFDEIDAGVSGKVALSVGKSIRKLIASHQVICITHLPQIASFGSAHYRVEKFVQNGRTFTRITGLNENERIKEIARLMGGEQISEVMLQSAGQLIGEARVQKK